MAYSKQLAPPRGVAKPKTSAARPPKAGSKQASAKGFCIRRREEGIPTTWIGRCAPSASETGTNSSILTSRRNTATAAARRVKHHLPSRSALRAPKRTTDGYGLKTGKIKNLHASIRFGDLNPNCLSAVYHWSAQCECSQMRTWGLVEAPAYRIRAACLQWARPSPYAASPIRNIFVEQTEQTP